MKQICLWSKKLKISAGLLVTCLTILHPLLAPGATGSLDCGWKSQAEVFGEALRILSKFETSEFDPNYRVFGFKYESKDQENAVSAYYESLALGTVLRSEQWQSSHPEMNLVYDSFKELMTGHFLESTREQIFLNFEVPPTYNSFASARPGFVALIDVSPIQMRSYLSSLDLKAKSSYIKFILGHEIGHLIVESIRTHEKGSFSTINEREFNGKLRHHLLVDATGILITEVSLSNALNALKSLSSLGDISKRIACWKKL